MRPGRGPRRPSAPGEPRAAASAARRRAPPPVSRGRRPEPQRTASTRRAAACPRIAPRCPPLPAGSAPRAAERQREAGRARAVSPNHKWVTGRLCPPWQSGRAGPRVLDKGAEVPAAPPTGTAGGRAEPRRASGPRSALPRGPPAARPRLPARPRTPRGAPGTASVAAAAGSRPPAPLLAFRSADGSAALSPAPPDLASRIGFCNRSQARRDGSSPAPCPVQPAAPDGARRGFVHPPGPGPRRERPLGARAAHGARAYFTGAVWVPFAGAVTVSVKTPFRTFACGRVG